MKKGDKFEVEIESLNRDGLGVTRSDESTILVAGSAVGDRVTVLVDHVSGHTNTAWCSVLSVEARGEQFRPPPCKNAAPTQGRCGGCPIMHLTQKAQEQTKLAATRATLTRTFDPPSISWHPAAEGLGYRNRANFVYSKGAYGQPLLGSFVPRGHQVSPMGGCLVVRPAIRHIHKHIQSALAQIQVPTFPGRHSLRYITIRASVDGEALVNFTVSEADPPWLKTLTTSTMGHPSVKGISLSINEDDSNAIRVGPSRTLAGAASLSETVGSISLELCADTFSQLNSEVASRMYRRAARHIENKEVVWDLYCGSGGLGLTCAVGRSDLQLLGADSISASVELAQKNAARMSVEARYAVADLAAGIPKGWPPANTVLVNPPRKGLDEAVIRALVESESPQQIIYMSCNPKSFEIDRDALLPGGYRTLSVDAYDMLPQTTHVELLAVLAR